MHSIVKNTDREARRMMCSSSIHLLASRETRDRTQALRMEMPTVMMK